MELIRHNYAKGEILELCKAAVGDAETLIANLIGRKGTVEQFEDIIANLLDATEPLIFMMNVHPDAAIRTDAQAAQQVLENYFIELYTRKELYDVLRNSPASAGDAGRRLLEKILRDFRRNGLDLDDATIAQVREKSKRLTELKSAFKKNLNENTDSIIISKDEAAGLPGHFIERLEQTAEGYKVSTNAADVVPFMTHCRSPDARRRMQEAYENREAKTNTPLLQEAVRLRNELAITLGYNQWGDYTTAVGMAKNASTVMQFLDGLRQKLAPHHQKDLQLLQSYKSADSSAPLQPWDVLYYENIARNKEYGIDDEKLREYFPATYVLQQMFTLYSTVLGITLSEVPASAWHADVKLYEVKDKDGTLLAHFYTDFFPRDGKYNHFAAFNLRDARLIDGRRVTPLAAIVGNFTPATQTTPSLLSHKEVETLFHEFGHIMHTTLNQAPYISLAAFRTAWDYVEAPSQMLENWVWTPAVLQQISRHHTTGVPLPEEDAQRLVMSRSFLESYHWTRQVFLATFDMRLHAEVLEPITAYKTLYKEIMGFDPVPTTHWPASFGHIMGGYEAGYYGYTWSKVFAQDMFTRFEKEGVQSPQVGAEYRKHILEPGDLRDANILIEEFLGRKQSDEAFLKLIGV